MGARARRRRGRANKPPRTASGTIVAQRPPAPANEWPDDGLEISILGPLVEFPLDEVGSRPTVPAPVPMLREHESARSIPIEALLRYASPANDRAHSPSTSRETVPTLIVPTRHALANDPRNTTLPVAPRPELLAACRPVLAPRTTRRRIGSALAATAVGIAIASMAALAVANRHRSTHTPTRAVTSMCAGNCPSPR